MVPAGGAHRAGAASVQDLGAIISAEVAPLPVRRCTPREALGATLAAPVSAGTAMPRADTAAMDGYAVNGDGPLWLLRSEVRVAGRSGGRALVEDCAVRIATGATTPRGTTAVLRDEHVVHTRASGSAAIALAAEASFKDDTRRRGEYWSQGQELVAAGAAVSAAVVSVATSAESTQLAVRGPVLADVLLTGDEIRAEGPLESGQTRDSLSPVLPEFLRACDIGCKSVIHLGDDPELLRAWFCASRTSPLMVVVGGTGRGAADHLRGVLDELGARMIIDGVAMRPGGSQLLAVLPDGRVVLCLPGNPFAAIAAVLVTGPAIVDALTARTPRPRLQGRIAGRFTVDAHRTRVIAVRQLTGGVWQSMGSPRTPHLADLVAAQALALTVPVGGLADLIMLPC
ncbi:putative molybdopterin biosynthesis protein [Nocardia nova SH22a]|uniref:Molybdopterin molybdenumtransferase n=1 Tax=Nocardia nova SH22a TaxID=1415166 RepID=W5TQE6_9NOCA|nr:molybdopterin-binding protein [Nocardia nova]AHH21467.1 putative molybdopterin biosynthesis protein [Nocardia nova SH22a]